MSERNYYVVCEDGCEFPAMTSEQILAAIQQALSTGRIQNIDSGFVTKIKELNAENQLTFWVGTKAQYDAVPEKAINCLYLVTDDSELSDIENSVDDLSADVENMQTVISPVVEKTANVNQLNKLIVSSSEYGVDNFEGGQVGFVLADLTGYSQYDVYMNGGSVFVGSFHHGGNLLFYVTFGCESGNMMKYTYKIVRDSMTGNGIDLEHTVIRAENLVTGVSQDREFLFSSIVGIY